MTYFQAQSVKEYYENLDKVSKQDWNKEWPTAKTEAPKKCSGCQRKLEKPKYKYELLIKPCKEFPDGMESSSSGQWRIDCKCGVCYIWSGGNIYKRTHREVELMMYPNEDGTLLIPLKIKLCMKNLGK